MLPLVSIVVPMYKTAAWVGSTIESIVRQTYPADRMEIIAIDDASPPPDDSADIARRILEQHPHASRVVIREKNGGLGSTRNVGWRSAKGDWIQFLDADDMLAPHKLELQATRAMDAAPDVAVVYSNWRSFELIEGTWQPTGPIQSPYVDDNPVVQMLKEPTFGYVGPTLIRRTFLESVGGFFEQPNLGEDFDLMLRIAMAGGRFQQVQSEEVAFLYRQTPGSQWKGYIKNKVALRNLLWTFRKAHEFLRERSSMGSLSADARTALIGRYSRFAEPIAMVDAETYKQVERWLNELGEPLPIGLNSRVRTLSKRFGFPTVVRARSAYRRHILRMKDM